MFYRVKWPLTYAFHEVTEKSKKRGKKSLHKVQHQKGIYVYQVSYIFFPRNTILALRLDIILGQIMIFLDSFVDVLDWDEYIIKRVLDIDKKGWVDIVGVKVSVSRARLSVDLGQPPLLKARWQCF